MPSIANVAANGGSNIAIIKKGRIASARVKNTCFVHVADFKI